MWAAEFSRGGEKPRVCWDLTRRVYLPWQALEGNSGVCVLSRHAQLLSSLQEGGLARYWQELLNKAHFSCRRMWNLQRAKDSINLLVNIFVVDWDWEKTKKSMWYGRNSSIQMWLNVVKYSKTWGYFKDRCEFQSQDWIHTNHLRKQSIIMNIRLKKMMLLFTYAYLKYWKVFPSVNFIRRRMKPSTLFGVS